MLRQMTLICISIVIIFVSDIYTYYLSFFLSLLLLIIIFQDQMMGAYVSPKLMIWYLNQFSGLLLFQYSPILVHLFNNSFIQLIFCKKKQEKGGLC